MFKKKASKAGMYPEDQYRPAVKSSICTGEQAAGFEEIKTGKFIELALIHDEKELSAWAREYGVDLSKIKKIW